MSFFFFFIRNKSEYFVGKSSYVVLSFRGLMHGYILTDGKIVQNFACIFFWGKQIFSDFQAGPWSKKIKSINVLRSMTYKMRFGWWSGGDSGKCRENQCVYIHLESRSKGTLGLELVWETLHGEGYFDLPCITNRSWLGELVLTYVSTIPKSILPAFFPSGLLILS